MEFDSKQSKVDSLAKFRSNINELAAGMELAVIVNKKPMMGVQILQSKAKPVVSEPLRHRRDLAHHAGFRLGPQALSYPVAVIILTHI